jgi:hypothetical protein
MDLFGNQKESKIRTLGFYQPFGSLMFHGKIETRWVRKGKKPPFPLGKYLFYTTQVPCSQASLFNWCGVEIMANITDALIFDETRGLNQCAIGIGTLSEVKLLREEDQKTFVKFVGNKTEIMNDISVEKVQWGLHFTDVQRIEPFMWNFGKQGIGFVPESELNKIKSLTK